MDIIITRFQLTEKKFIVQHLSNIENKKVEVSSDKFCSIVE